MAFSKIINKGAFFLVPFWGLVVTASMVKSKVHEMNINGRWKSVKHDYRGRQKFSLQQANLIRSSVLTIEQNTFNYSKAQFIKSCNFYTWKKSPYDTTVYDNLQLIYTNAELQKLTIFDPVDKAGNLSCFNECALFYLKQDTLINLCGGYIFYWVKIK